MGNILSPRVRVNPSNDIMSSNTSDYSAQAPDTQSQVVEVTTQQPIVQVMLPPAAAAAADGRKMNKVKKSKSKNKNKVKKSKSKSKNKNKVKKSIEQCKKELQKKIRINMYEYKSGRYKSPKQALAVSYSQIKKKYPSCKKYFDKK